MLVKTSELLKTSPQRKKPGNGSLRKAFEPSHYNINIKRSLISNIYLEAVQITAEPPPAQVLKETTKPIQPSLILTLRFANDLLSRSKNK